MGKEGENSRVSLAAAPQPKYNDDRAKNRISCCQWFFARFRGLANLFHSWPSPRITFTPWQRAYFVAIYTQIYNVMYSLFFFGGQQQQIGISVQIGIQLVLCVLGVWKVINLF